MFAVADAEAAHGARLDLKSVPIFFAAQRVIIYLIKRSDVVIASVCAIIKWMQ